MTEKHAGGRPIQAQISMCKYRRRGVECSKWQRNCSICGWNPEVEEERKKKILSGEVDSYLKINLDDYKKTLQSEFRKHVKGGDK